MAASDYMFSYLPYTFCKSTEIPPIKRIDERHDDNERFGGPITSLADPVILRIHDRSTLHSGLIKYGHMGDAR